jgi:hypothetical protein
MCFGGFLFAPPAVADPNPSPPPTETIKFWKVEIPASEHWAIKTMALLLATLAVVAIAVVVTHSGAGAAGLLRLLFD